MSANIVALVRRLAKVGSTAYDLLSEVREQAGAVTTEDISRLARSSGFPAAHLFSVASFYDEFQPDRPPLASRLRVCSGEACRVAGGDAVARELGRRLDGAVETVTCLGLCSGGPNLVLDGRAVVVESEEVLDLVAEALRDGKPLDRSEPENPIHFPAEDRPCILLERIRRAPSGRLVGPPAEAYAALRTARALGPEAVLELIVASGLRGRGGAGFPTGRKLATVAAAPAVDGRRFVVANLDEGDAGAYIDKELAERDPHLLLEGVLIAAFACGAGAAYIYVRHEYPHAVFAMERAIAEVSAVGEGAVPIYLVRGQGAYVCGEETSLLRSIEGLPGQASLRPPYPALRGLWGCPTAVNNVETLCSLPWIVAHGGTAHAGLGMAGSTGTKLVSLNNRVRRPGLHEVEMGTTLRDLVFEHAGGMAVGHRFRAVQIGGPLGAILPESALDAPIGFESLAAVGGTLGHGGMVVFSDQDDLLAIGRGLMAFAARESCGKCFPCRIGTVRGVELLDRIAVHGLTPERRLLLEELCETMRLGSLCGLGGMAPTPIESLLAHFPEIWP